MSELRQFQPFKIVRAAKIEDIVRHRDGTGTITFADPDLEKVKVDEAYMKAYDPQDGGYFVVTEEGAAPSYASAESFEADYRELPPPGTPHPTLRWFHYKHLPPGLREVSQQFHDLAANMDGRLPNSHEKSKGLDKLLEAKDCFVRCERASIGGEPEPKPNY